MQHRSWILAGVYTLVAACGLPPQDQPSAGSSDTGEGSTGADPGSSSGVGSTTAPGTDATTASSDGSDGSGSDGTTGDDPPLSVCDPQPEWAPSFVGLDFDEDEPFLDIGEVIELDVACVVSGIAPVDGLVSIELACDDAPHVLDIADLGPIDVAVGDSVTLRAHDSQPWQRLTFVALLRDGVLVAAGMNAPGLPDGGNWEPDASFFEPLAIEHVGDVCRPEPRPEEDPDGCEFICEPVCYQEQRQALRFTLGDQSALVHDAGRGSLEGLELSVGRARRHLDVTCADTPAGWTSFLVVRPR